MSQLEKDQMAEFGKYFSAHLKDYSIIGGAATLVHLDERGADHNKATRDLDVAVLDLTPDGVESPFLKKFQEYVNEMQYEAFTAKTEKVCAYRFVRPKKGVAPSQIEIATRKLDGLQLQGTAQRLVEQDISAIACEPIYIEHLLSNSEPKTLGSGGGPVSIARVPSIILMKALAFINLSKGQAKPTEHAGRHAADIVRLSAVLTDADRLKVAAQLYKPLEELFSVKDRAFPLDRVTDLRGAGITADRVISDIESFITKEE